ncbi:hypothetical protein [Cellulosimicrobium funkei]|uniref:hypothetical protein n=1 Tax=Cellulosimicrobium funkei TaxID=264251 RepID=UPI00341EE51D
MTATPQRPSCAGLPDGDEHLTFVGIFSLTDRGLDMTKGELIREAEEGPLADLLVENSAVLDGPPEWRIDTADDSTVYLSVTGPARRWNDRGGYRGRDLTKLATA